MLEVLLQNQTKSYNHHNREEIVSEKRLYEEHLIAKHAEVF